MYKYQSSKYYETYLNLYIHNNIGGFMSTRCQIRFMETYSSENGKKETYAYQIYRHSDGYLNGVIPDFYEFFKWYMSAPMQRNGDPSYAAGDFIYWCKQNVFDEEMKKDGYDKIGYGVENVGEIHGDEEWLYEVDLTGAKTPDEILVRYSDDFPENDAFEKAKWSKWYKLGQLYEKVSQAKK